jgi:hypothetical protein
MAVALAKRYCRDDQFGMEWADFLRQEVTKIRQFVHSAAYPTGTPTNANVSELVDELLTRATLLRRVCLICGRWGTDQAVISAIKAIQALSFQSEPRGGYVVWSSLREFCAAQCFYWLLGGLLEKVDWRAVKRLLDAQVQGNGERPFLITFLPFEASGVESWKFLPGMQSRKFAASDYMVEIFKRDAIDAAIDDRRAEELFDELEILVAFSFTSARIADGTIARGSYWVPLGRFVYRGNGLDDAMARIEALDAGDDFFAAGMLGGKKESASLVFKAIRDLRQAYPQAFSRFF